MLNSDVWIGLYAGLKQCFHQTAPLWESRVAFREGP